MYEGILFFTKESVVYLSSCSRYKRFYFNLARNKVQFGTKLIKQYAGTISRSKYTFCYKLL